MKTIALICLVAGIYACLGMFGAEPYPCSCKSNPMGSIIYQNVKENPMGVITYGR